jgi:hypothetical protein
METTKKNSNNSNSNSQIEKTMSIDEMKAIINWAATEGVNNWGAWSHFPKIDARFLSYEKCKIFIKLNHIYLIDGVKVSAIINDGGVPPKRGKDVITLSDVKRILKKDGVKFDGDVTHDFFVENLLNEKKRIEKVICDFKNLYTNYDYQKELVVKQFEKEMTRIEVKRILGEPFLKEIDYILNIKNYCGEKEGALKIKATLTGNNARKTKGLYKATSFDQSLYNDLVELFTQEHLDSAAKMLKIHLDIYNSFLTSNLHILGEI